MHFPDAKTIASSFSSFIEAIELVHGEGFRALVEKEAGKRTQRTPLTRRR